jgi:hypothetical protein
MFTKIGRLAVVIAAAGLLWPVTVSWAGERSLETMRAKDYMILESMRLKPHPSEPILAAMETGEAIPEDDLGGLRGGIDTFFLVNIAGSAGGGPTKTASFNFAESAKGSSGGSVGVSDEDAQSLSVISDFNGGCCFFQINQATNSDNNTFVNNMIIDIAMITVANEAQLNSVVNTVQKMLQ